MLTEISVLNSFEIFQSYIVNMCIRVARYIFKYRFIFRRKL